MPDQTVTPPIGVWLRATTWGGREDELVRMAPELEEMGYGSIWIGGADGDLQLIRRLLESTSRMVVATAIVNIWKYRPADVTRNYGDLPPSMRSRAWIGFGVGHGDQIRENKPYSAMVSYLDELDAQPQPIPKKNRFLAALGDRMLRLAAARTAGAHPYLVNADYIRRARTVLGPDAFFAPELRGVMSEDPKVAREVGWASVNGNMVRDPNYRTSLLRQGFSEGSLEYAGSDELIDGVVAWGDAASIARRVSDYMSAGADYVPVQLLTPDGGLPVDAWRAFAPQIPALVAS